MSALWFHNPGLDFGLLQESGPHPLPSFPSIEGEYVPVAGDEVTYKVCTIPPKNEKLQAVEVIITHLVPGTKHETWSGQVISS